MRRTHPGNIMVCIHWGFSIAFIGPSSSSIVIESKVKSISSLGWPVEAPNVYDGASSWVIGSLLFAVTVWVTVGSAFKAIEWGTSCTFVGLPPVANEDGAVLCDCGDCWVVCRCCWYTGAFELVCGCCVGGPCWGMRPRAAPSRLCFASRLARKREYNIGVWRSSIAICGDPIVLTSRSMTW